MTPRSPGHAKTWLVELFQGLQVSFGVPDTPDIAEKSRLKDGL